MSGFFKHFIRGMKNSIIVDVPDFETNNQYIDMINIGNDLRTSMGRLSNGESSGETTKDRRNKSFRQKRKATAKRFQ
jgi:hypothetical protein